MLPVAPRTNERSSSFISDTSQGKMSPVIIYTINPDIVYDIMPNHDE